MMRIFPTVRRQSSSIKIDTHYPLEGSKTGSVVVTIFLAAATFPIAHRIQTFIGPWIVLSPEPATMR